MQGNGTALVPYIGGTVCFKQEINKGLGEGLRNRPVLRAQPSARPIRTGKEPS